MPVSRRRMLESVTRMLADGATDHATIYVGKRQTDAVPRALEASAAAFREAGRFLEVERADFGDLFRHVDAFVVHGGLGTTVEALRMHKPIAVTGILLMDQRFWGQLVADKGVGPPPCHIDYFASTAYAAPCQ